ncbi:MAG: ABC transporter permease [Deltaproteobacteria bacterium]|nr:ABC transporter permease [Deltaproteobacteria bacterium]
MSNPFLKAVELIFSFDKQLFDIIFLSVKVSGFALIIASVFGIPIAVFTAFKKFPLKSLFINIMNTFMGAPPVAVGLIFYLLLSRSGMLGFLGILYTPYAMILAQTFLAFPIIASLCHSAIVGVDPLLKQASITLGASPFTTAATIINEARYGIMSALIAASGRLFAEVGAILIVGGNIAGLTRVMTTAIALETDKGDFELAVALGIILILISFTINFSLNIIQKKGKKELI